MLRKEMFANKRWSEPTCTALFIPEYMLTRNFGEYEFLKNMHHFGTQRILKKTNFIRPRKILQTWNSSYAKGGQYEIGFANRRNKGQVETN